MNTEPSNREPGGVDDVWRDLRTLVETIAVFGFAVLLGRVVGFLPPVSVSDQIVLLLAATAVSITNLFGIWAYGEVAYHRKGFELCGITVVAVLATYATWFASFRIERWVDVLGGPRSWGAVGRDHQFAWLFLVFLAALFLLWVTGRVGRALTREGPRWPALLSVLAYTCGVVSLSLYVGVILVTG